MYICLDQLDQADAHRRRCCSAAAAAA